MFLGEGWDTRMDGGGKKPDELPWSLQTTQKTGKISTIYLKHSSVNMKFECGKIKLGNSH